MCYVVSSPLVEVLFTAHALFCSLSRRLRHEIWIGHDHVSRCVEFKEEIAARINWLYENALLPRVRHRIWNIRWVYPQRFPYRIIYRVEEDSVLIIPILHSARRERHWRSRMRT